MLESILLPPADASIPVGYSKSWFDLSIFITPWTKFSLISFPEVSTTTADLSSDSCTKFPFSLTAALPWLPLTWIAPSML